MKKDKYEKEKRLLSEMLAESLCEDYDEIIRSSGMTADCSEEQKQRIRDTVYGKKPTRINWSNAWKIAVALLAGLLTLAGCAFCVMGGRKIAGYIEYAYETYICVERDNEEPCTLEQIYELTYVPDGFELYEKTITPVLIDYKWQTADLKYLKFTQTPSFTQFYMDINNNFDVLLKLNDICVYHREYENSYNYIWCDDKNSFKLTSTNKLENEEIINIITGMTITK